MTVDQAALAASASSCTALPPGFRFHPTDEELILHYLRKRAAAAPCPAPVIAEVDIYKFDPWDLPAKAVFGEGEWYFFSPRERKYPNGVRPNRAAGSGYWKATGTDKPITLSGARGDSESRRAMIGVKKALVFYKGRPPKGMKTSWIMHEYRLAEALAAVNTYRPTKFKNASMKLDDWVLCRIYKKTSPQLYSSAASPNDAAEHGAMDGFGPLHDDPVAVVDDVVVAAYGRADDGAGRLPRPVSISDYLVDYSAVSELFESLPAPGPDTAPPAIALQLGTDAAAGSSSRGAARFYDVATTTGNNAQGSSHKRRLFMEEGCSGNGSGGMEQMLHAPSSSKRVMLSDHDQQQASMAVNNAFSVFETAGQTFLHQDRI